MDVYVGSTNPVKIKAAESVFQQIDPRSLVTGLEVQSGVSEQPWGLEETRTGALNRAEATLAYNVRYGIGIESGLLQTTDGVMTVNWCVIISSDRQMGVSSGFSYLLPRPIADRVLNGEVLSHVVDSILNMEHIGKGPGASGILTGFLVNRQQGYEQLIALAMAPFRRPDLYRP